MNASASSLDREVEVQSEIRKVRRFGRTARVVCSAIFGLGLVGVIFTLLVAVLGLFFPKIHSATTALAMTPELKMWMTLLTGVVAAWFAQLLDPADAAQLAVYLHGLAGDLAAADEGEVAMVAGDLVDRLGDAVLELTSTRRRKAGESSTE